MSILSKKKKPEAKISKPNVVKVIKVEDGFDMWVKPNKSQIKLNQHKDTVAMALSLEWKKIS
jgi:hypothetical protein